MEPARLQTASRPFAVPTPHGPARVHLHLAEAPRGGLVLGHGAGGGVDAPDLRVSCAAALARGFSVALVEQPYRVAGRRAPAPATQLDAAFSAVVTRLARTELQGLGLVLGGRSMGARVACRTAESLSGTGVLCLAFPLLAPARATSSRPPTSRLPELEAVRLPVLVVGGDRDRFGIPPAGPQRQVVTVAGDHALRADLKAVEAAVGDWLSRL